MASRRVTELLADIDALNDVRDLVLVTKAVTQRLAFMHARAMRATVEDIGARVEIVDLNRDLDGLTGTIVGSKKQPRRGETHFVILELDQVSVARLTQRSAKWRQTLNAGAREIPVSRSNLSILRP